MAPTLDDYIEESEKYDTDDKEDIPSEMESEINNKINTASSETE